MQMVRRSEFRLDTVQGSPNPLESDANPSDCFMGAPRESITPPGEREINGFNERQVCYPTYQMYGHHDLVNEEVHGPKSSRRPLS